MIIKINDKTGNVKDYISIVSRNFALWINKIENIFRIGIRFGKEYQGEIKRRITKESEKQ